MWVTHIIVISPSISFLFRFIYLLSRADLSWFYPIESGLHGDSVTEMPVPNSTNSPGQKDKRERERHRTNGLCSTAASRAAWQGTTPISKASTAPPAIAPTAPRPRTPPQTDLNSDLGPDRRYRREVEKRLAWSCLTAPRCSLPRNCLPSKYLLFC